MKWKTLKSETAYKTDFFKITKDKCEKSDGGVVEEYYTIDRPTVAVIVALTSENEVVLVNQYRHPVKNTDIEIPAGYIEDYETDIEQAAHRELLEETGYKVEKMEKMQEVYSSAGLMSNNIHFFIGFNAKKTQEPTLDENEELEVLTAPFDKAIKLIEEKKIMDMASVTGILLAKKHLEKQ